MENKRTGGGECRAGTGSPRKTFALARWMQHEIIPYQRHISADGSKPRAEARAWASFLVKLIVSLAQPVPLEGKRAKIEWMNPSTSLWIKHWMFCILFISLSFSNFTSCALTSSVSLRIRI